MRNAIFRMVAIAVLALAVPIQGMGAVSAGQCMAFDPAHDHGHGDADSADSHANQDSGDGGARPPHCGPCVACCASAYIASRAELSLLAARSEVQYFVTQFPPLGVQPDGLDRPPLVL
jgi:hypothetical protein